MSINSLNGNTLLESGSFPPCRAATTGPIALTGLQTIDGVVLSAGDRVLVLDQADQTTNGIYAASTGPWLRTRDAASNQDFFSGMGVTVAQGALNGGQTFLCTCTDDPVVVGTSQLTFASQSAVATATQTATSATSATIGTGAKTFVIQAGKAFAVNQWVLIAETSNAANNMLAQVTAYAGTSLSVSVAAIGGAGTHADWTIVLNNSPAAAGLSPPVGTGNTTGAGSSTAGHLATFADGTGKVLSDSGLPAGNLAGLSATTFATTGAASVGPAALAGGAGGPPFVAAQPTDNLTLANDGTNPSTDIQITPGRAPDDGGTYWLALAATMLKRIDVAWSAGGAIGNRQGMLLAGSSWLANGTYHVWLIGAIGLAVTSVSRSANVATLTIAGHPLGAGGTIRSYGLGGGFGTPGAVITAVTTNTVSYANPGADTGAIPVTAAFADGFDIGCTSQASQAYPNATLPSGYTVKQRLGSLITNPSKNILLFLHVRDEFMWQTPTDDVSNNNSSNLTASLRVPSGLRVMARIFVNMQSAVGTTNAKVGLFVSTADFPLPVSVLNAQYFSDTTIGSGSLTLNNGNASIAKITDNQAQLHFSWNGTLSVQTEGWRDFGRALF